MIYPAKESGWEGVSPIGYKNEPGTWMDVARHPLYADPNSSFEVRAFELGPGGYTSLEKHGHEHCVVVLSGHGTVTLEDETAELKPHDVVRVPSWAVHQFKAGPEGLTILCIVDQERDRPVLIEPGFLP